MSFPGPLESPTAAFTEFGNTSLMQPGSRRAEQQKPRPTLLDYRRIVIAVGDGTDDFIAKTAIGLLRYRADDIIAVIAADRAGRCAQDVFGAGGAIPVVSSLNEVQAADSVFIGTAPLGGLLSDSLRRIVRTAVSMGIDIVSGLHEFLVNDAVLCQLAHQTGCQLIDVRKNELQTIAQAARFRSDCLRVHTVGNDCSVGKMTVSLELEKGLLQRQVDARFLATGQTGIMIAGDGVPVDCVVADFINGAVEGLVQRHEQHDILLIEGQGGVTHPAYSGVTLGLLHGCAPQALILCYEAGRTHFKGLKGVEIPSLKCLRELYEQIASHRFPSKVIGVAMNGKNISEERARMESKVVQAQLGLPVCDVFREGPAVLIEAILAFQKLITKIPSAIDSVA